MKKTADKELIAWVVAGFLALSGCVAAQPESVRKPALLDNTALESAARSGSYARDEQLLDRAERELTGRCMRSRGLPYSGPGSATSGTIDDEWHPDLGWRRRFGYGLYTDYAQSGGQPPMSDSDREVAGWPASRQADYQRALMGDDGKRSSVDVRQRRRFTFPTDGCVADSRKALYGSPEEAAKDFYFLQDVAGDLDRQVRADSRYLAAVHDWSGCMDLRGYRYPSPSEARAELGKRYERQGAGPALRDLEIATATEDAECAGNVRLPVIAVELAKARATALSPEDQRDLITVTTSRSAAIKRAQAVVGR